MTEKLHDRNVHIKYFDDKILDDRNFIHTISFADMVPTMQSGKKRMFTVTTHRIHKHKL